MGTRADFYVGRGTEAEWLGSIAWDGHPGSTFEKDFTPTECATPEQWREKVATFLAGRDDGTTPDRGWPWPWENSCTTDYTYAWDDGKVYGSSFGHAWFVVDAAADNFGEPESDDEGGKIAEFPDMTVRKSVARGLRSGTIMFTTDGVL